MQQAVVGQVRELARQRQLSNLPAFVAGIKHRDGADYLELTNIGKGIAINMTIDPVVIRYPTMRPGRIQFDGALMVRAGETIPVESTEFPITSSDPSSDEGNRNSLTFLGTHAHYDVDVNIRFQDIEGTNYLQTLRMGPGGYRHGFVKLDEGLSNT